MPRNPDDARSGEKKQRKPRAVRRAKGDGEARKIGSVIRQTTSTQTFRDGLHVGRLHLSWDRVAGEQLAGRTTPGSLAGGVLTIECESAPWTARVRFAAEQIRRSANETLGSEVVRSVRAVVASSTRNR